MRIQFDTVAGAQVEIAGQLSTIVRTGLILDVPGSANADPGILLQATQAVFSAASQGYTGLSGTAPMSRLILTPTNGTNDLRFSASFIIPTQNFVNDPQQVMTWLVEVTTTLQMETEQIDTMGNPNQTYYYADGGKVQTGAGGGIVVNTSTSNQPAKNTADFSVLRPRQTLSISGYTSDASQFSGCQGKVNSKPWNSMPAGFWLCTELQSRAQNAYPNSGSTAGFVYHVRASFVSKVNRNWSSYAIHRGPTGKIPQNMVSPEAAAAIRQAVYGNNPTKPNPLPYSQTPYRTINGVLIVGMYFQADFKKIFDFSLDDYLT